MKTSTPNPAGRRGKPIIVPNMNLDDALRKILAVPPEPKTTKKTSSKKTARKK